MKYSSVFRLSLLALLLAATAVLYGWGRRDFGNREV